MNDIRAGKARKHKIVCNTDIKTMPILTSNAHCVRPPQLRYSTTDIQSPANVYSPDGLAPTTFPWQLHLLLDDAEIKGFSDVVSWLEGGTMFKVHKTKEFANRIMPCYFNQTRYKSFQRQLNSYRFHRFVAGKNKGTCFHDLFTRDKPDLCRHINRVKVNRGRAADPAQQQESHAMKYIDGCMFEPVAITYPSGYSKVEMEDSEEKACDFDQDLREENQELSNLGRHLFHPRMKISDCIPPVIASEIVNIFGSHGGGDNLFNTY
jgi:hypothetical protein